MRRPKILMTGHWEPLAIYKKPFVGMTWNYYEAIVRAGGMPILLPYCGDMDDYIEMSDGLVLTGGYDIDPVFYNEEVKYNTVEITRVRDDLEKTLLDKWLKTGKPIFGICRGLQFLNIYFGGTLYQDIPVECGVIHSDVVHKVVLEEGTWMRDLFDSAELVTNSHHHQGVKKLGEPLRSMAIADDGIVEAAYYPGKKFVMGVQWHPEILGLGDKVANNLFTAFVEACAQNMK